jgi:hypothetical protein
MHSGPIPRVAMALRLRQWEDLALRSAPWDMFRVEAISRPVTKLKAMFIGGTRMTRCSAQVSAHEGLACLHLMVCLAATDSLTQKRSSFRST